MADTPIVSYSSAAGPVHGDIFAGSSDVITKPGTLVSGAGAAALAGGHGPSADHALAPGKALVKATRLSRLSCKS